jgi:hypothetical protein
VRPAAFLRGIRRQGDFVNPLVFAVICSLFRGVIDGFLNMLNAIVAGTTGVSGAIASFVGSTMFTPIFVAVFLFVGAGIYHLLVLLFVGPPDAGFEATYRVAGYACAIFLISRIGFLFNLIPVIGPIIGGSLGLLLGVYAVVM